MTHTDNLIELPEDWEALRAKARSLLEGHGRERQHAEAQAQRAREQQQRGDDLYLENLRLQVELGV